MQGKTVCYIHGGKSNGAPKGSHNALKHGLYADSLSPSERDAWEKIDVATIDDEIKIAKLQLRRARKYQHEIDEEIRDGLETEEIRNGTERGDSTELLVKKRVDIQGHIDRCLLRIGDLVSKRRALGGESNNEQFDKFIAACETPPVENGGA
jgi:hypothetical protein